MVTLMRALGCGFQVSTPKRRAKLVFNQQLHIFSDFCQKTRRVFRRNRESAHKNRAIDGIYQPSYRHGAWKFPIFFELPKCSSQSSNGSSIEVIVDRNNSGLSCTDFYQDTSHCLGMSANVHFCTNTCPVFQDFSWSSARDFGDRNKVPKSIEQKIFSACPTQVDARFSDASRGGNPRKVKTGPSNFAVQIYGSRRDSVGGFFVSGASKKGIMMKRRTGHQNHSFFLVANKNCLPSLCKTQFGGGSWMSYPQAFCLTNYMLL